MRRCPLVVPAQLALLPPPCWLSMPSHVNTLYRLWPWDSFHHRPQALRNNDHSYLSAVNWVAIPLLNERKTLRSFNKIVTTWFAKMGVPFEALIPYGIIIGVSFDKRLTTFSIANTRHRCTALPVSASVLRNIMQTITRRHDGTEMSGIR